LRLCDDGDVFIPLTKVGLARYINRQRDALIQIDAATAQSGFAIYTLSDPRDLGAVRYVGQTAAPVRRYTQHVNTARLWLPDEVPWWFQSPKRRPLYEWIRELHREDYRLPVMLIRDWAGTPAVARLKERAFIYDCLNRRVPLLNIETELLGPQIPLAL
jgi:hypothetical protein